ncbi:MAG: M23 family metallopeptidase [Candidatus Electryonea clarkiae]|nr:M23 family metallopeptidase [Candidatus Electryonea clarkiae]MDP8288378.1 M23 family metallopeptidase [Candidatus Electryonea clarkiae]
MSRNNKPHHLILWYRPLDDRPKEWILSKGRFRILAVLLTIIVVTLILASVFYAGLIRRSFERSWLKKENLRLRAEVARIQLIKQDLDELQRFGEQVKKGLTEGADLGRILKANVSEKAKTPSRVFEDGSWISLEGSQTPIEDSVETFRTLFASNQGLSEIPRNWPLEGFITRGFEPAVINPRQSHTGIDIAVSRGTPVKTVAGGIVLASDWTPRLGNRVIIDHGGGVLTFYGHNEMLLVKPHDIVQAGEIISLSGNSGISTAPHLHFEIWLRGRAVDPLLLLPRIDKEMIINEEE